jgi:uncharacterized membrane protein (UPF0127 family)
VLRLAAAALAAAGGVTFPHADAVIATGNRSVELRVEVASTDAQRAQGLMNRRRLAPKAGMVFLFAQPTRTQFWMKETLIPLSIAFYDRSGRILRILDMAPCRAAVPGLRRGRRLPRRARGEPRRVPPLGREARLDRQVSATQSRVR